MAAGFKRSSTASLNLQVSGLNATRRAARSLGDKDAPYVIEALRAGGQLLESAAQRHARGGIASSISFTGVKGSGFNGRALVVAKHPGSRPMEFGRKFYLAGYKIRRGRAIGGHKVARRGQEARPFIGVVKQDAAVGEIIPRFRAEMGQALQREFERIAAGGDD